MDKYTRETFDKLLKDINDEIDDLANSMMENAAVDIKKEIETLHGNAYNIDVEKTDDKIELSTTDDKAVQLEYGIGMPAWRKVHSDYKAKTDSELSRLRSKGFKT